MHAKKYPFAVRLIGFAPEDGARLGDALAQSAAAGPSYSCLLEDSLQEPDLYLANGKDLKALAQLSAAAPGPLHPALLVGEPAADLPFPRIGWPVEAAPLHALLRGLIEQRADAMAALTARGLPSVPERRRQPRLDIDLSDPALHASRRQPPPSGAVLIIDKGGAFRDHVARLLGARKLAVEWTDSAPTAVRLCDETPVSVVMINTSTPGVDPYALCASIKAQGPGLRIAVVFLVGAAFAYDSARARAAGARGLLDKPVADRHLVAALQKLLSLPS